MKIVVNAAWGGFSLSEVAEARWRNESGSNVPYWDIPRDDPILVSIVEELAEDSWGRWAELKVVEIPDGIEWRIEDHDGLEHIAEVHRTWS